MGANYSTVEDKKAHVASPSTVPIAFASDQVVHTFNNRNYNHNHNNDNNKNRQKRSVTTSRASAAMLVQPSMAAKNSNRINAFHSRASWSGYLEATKAFNNLVVVCFATMWHEPCRYMEPIVKGFAATYTNVEFVKIDSDELPDISNQHGVGTTPTFVFIKKGKIIDKVVGAKKEELQRKIEKNMV